MASIDAIVPDVLSMRAEWLPEYFTPTETRERLQEIWKEGDPEIDPGRARAFRMRPR